MCLRSPYRPFKNRIETERADSWGNISILGKKSTPEGQRDLSEVEGQVINPILVKAVTSATGI